MLDTAAAFASWRCPLSLRVAWQYADAERDPFAAMLLYVALGPSKHSVLTQLFRLSKHSSVFNFLSQDPTQDKWVGIGLGDGEWRCGRCCVCAHL
jgi:hypothetical protein